MRIFLRIVDYRLIATVDDSATADSAAAKVGFHASAAVLRSAIPLPWDGSNAGSCRRGAIPAPVVVENSCCVPPASGHHEPARRLGIANRRLIG
jgi:hypothetical protein